MTPTPDAENIGTVNIIDQIENRFILSPNPASDFIKIEVQEERLSFMKINIIDGFGRSHWCGV